MAQPQNEGNAFTFDDDEDMDALLEAAANAGTAAIDELDGELAAEATGPVPLTVTPPREPEPVAVVDEPALQHDEELDALLNVDFDDIEATVPAETVFEQAPPAGPSPEEKLRREMESLRAESEQVLAAPVVVAPPAPPVVAAPVITAPPVVPVAQAPVAQATSGAHKIIRQTEEDQIARARAVIDASDEFRKLPAATRDIVAQLISQEQDFTADEATIAIRAINADELTFATMAALKEAKGHSPVDRAFYILGLNAEVRDALGSLVSAFAGTEFPDRDNNLVFSKALVAAIDGLDSEAISFVSATEAVLRAAKQR